MSIALKHLTVLKQNIEVSRVVLHSGLTGDHPHRHVPPRQLF